MSDHHPDECPTQPHSHPIHGMFFLHGHAIVMDHRIAVLIPDGAAHLAPRICELLDRYGVVDVPDTPATLCWPAPDPTARIHDHRPPNTPGRS